MRYMGSVGALSSQESAFVAGFQQAYPQLSDEAQSVVFDATVREGGGQAALTKQRAIFGGAGVVVGVVLALAMGRRRR